MFRRPYAAAVLAFAMILSLAEPSWAQAAIHLALGNPSNAATDKENPDPQNYLMDKGLFVLSYNSKKGTPNWVSWRLVKADLGPAERKKNPFHPDSELPAQFRKVTPADYNNTNFDRGHMCPNGHRTTSEEAEAQTFVMTNMVPQPHHLNAGAWKSLEDRCRKLANDGKELYIIAGPWGEGGVAQGATNVTPSLANGAITVPSHCWKVVLVLEPGDGPPLERITKDTQVISVIMANDLTKQDIKSSLRSVAEIEAKTGFKFFTNVPAEIRDALTGAATAKLGPSAKLGQPDAEPVPPGPRVMRSRRLTPFRGLDALRPGILFPRRIR